MALSKFPEELIFQRQAVREVDPHTDIEHVWIQDADNPNNWSRLAIPVNAEVQEVSQGINSLPLKVQRCRYSTWLKLKRLLQRIETINGPLEDRGPIELIDIPRSALLVWAGEAEVNLTVNEIADIFSDQINVHQLADAWIVEKITSKTKVPNTINGHEQKDTPQRADTIRHIVHTTDTGNLLHDSDASDEAKLRTDMRELGDRILDSVGALGIVVADINVENAKRICICLKQNHGNPKRSTEKAIQNPDYGQLFITHQNQLTLLQKTIADLSEKHTLHIFQENSLMDWDSVSYAKERMQEDVAIGAVLRMFGKTEAVANPIEFARKRCNEAEKDRAASIKLWRFFDALSREMPDLEFDRFMYDYLGENRFINDAVASNIQLAGRVHGLTTRERLALISEQERYIDSLVDLTTCMAKVKERIRFFSCSAENLFNRNSCNTINETLSNGSIGIFVVGGLHFNAGTLPQVMSSEEVGIRRITTPAIEDLMHKISDLRTIVIEPSTYSLFAFD